MTIRIEDIRDMDFSDVADLSKGRAAPIRPGEILLDEFLTPLGISQCALAAQIHLEHQQTAPPASHFLP